MLPWHGPSRARFQRGFLGCPSGRTSSAGECRVEDRPRRAESDPPLCPSHRRAWGRVPPADRTEDAGLAFTARRRSGRRRGYPCGAPPAARGRDPLPAVDAPEERGTGEDKHPMGTPAGQSCRQNGVQSLLELDPSNRTYVPAGQQLQVSTARPSPVGCGFPTSTPGPLQVPTPTGHAIRSCEARNVFGACVGVTSGREALQFHECGYRPTCRRETSRVPPIRRAGLSSLCRSALLRAERAHGPPEFVAVKLD